MSIKTLILVCKYKHVWATIFILSTKTYDPRCIIHENYVSRSVEMYSVLNTYTEMCLCHAKKSTTVNVIRTFQLQSMKNRILTSDKSHSDPMKRSFCESGKKWINFWSEKSDTIRMYSIQTFFLNMEGRKSAVIKMAFYFSVK